ncbi:uncharacterized protein N7482_007998, partial [Penicillium canariense]
YRERGDFTDLKIVYDRVEFNVYKIILCSQSPIFQSAYTRNFKEVVESTYQIIDKSVSIIKKMLDYLYTGKYSETFDKKEADDLPKIPPLSLSALQLYTQIFSLGDKYIIPELYYTAIVKYSKKALNRFNPVEYLKDVFFLLLSSNRELKELAIRFSRDNLVSYLDNK